VAGKRWNLFLPMAALVLAQAGCGGGSTAHVQNPPAPATSNVTIAFQPAPSGSITVNATTPFTAVVSNDPNNAGVDWTVTCSNTGNCGTLSSVHTGSGQATLYTPPPTLPGNNQAVTIIAYATADHAENVVAPLTISAFGSSLKGTYVLQAEGTDSSFDPYQFGGVIVLDGNGGITSGEQTANFFDQNAGALLSKSDPIVGGSYFLGADGRGTITINTADLDVGQNGVETFSLVFLSASHSLIAQNGAAASATGSMDLQTAVAPPSGGYAFVVRGTDVASQSPTSFGGVFNIDSPNAISGNGSIADQNLAGTLTQRQSLSGTLSAPDSFGAVTFQLTAGFATGPILFTGYIVDATHIQLVESDNSGGAGYGSTGGIAIGQGSATGTFTDVSSFTGTYVFAIAGTDLSGFTPDTFASVGLFTADGAGNFTNGYTDMLLQQNGAQGNAGAQISGSFTGTYSVDTKGTGRVRAPLSHFVPVPHPAIHPLLFFYLTGNGNPPLILDGGDTSVNLDYPSLGTGSAYPQSASSLSFSGEYGLAFFQQNGEESNGTGQITVSSSDSTVSGSLDVNSGFNPTFNNPVTGTFQPILNGQFAGTLSSLVFDFSPFAADFYVVDANHGFFVETDLVDPNGPSGTVTLGYYATRTPVCNGCP
jgi:hypothetical protein